MPTVLLSRVAESLFWIGRYVERAEGTARILDVVVHHALEERGVDPYGMGGRLLEVMGVADAATSKRPDLSEVARILTFGAGLGTSIAGSLEAARDNARAVRHVLPTELWERLNSTWVALNARRQLSERSGSGAFLGWVKDQTAAITGLVDTTMSRDQTWLFLTLGRSLERADVTARLLGSLPINQLTESGLVTLLRSCGGYEPYLRQAHGVVERESVVDFLLRDRFFPRSALRSLTVAVECVEQIGGAHAHGWDEARGVIGMVRAELEFIPPALLLDRLPQLLASLHKGCTAASDKIAERYFTHSYATEWHQRGLA
jgi:uncharacterized alpha-E superfamily protein